MEIVYILTGLILGAIALYFLMNAKLGFAESEKVRLENELKESEDKLRNLTAENENLKEEIRNWELKYASLEGDLRVKNREIENKKQSIEENEKKLKEMQDLLKSEFKNLANEILDEKSKSFSESSRRDIDELLKPLRTKIDEFKKQVSETYEKETRERFSLVNEIKKLSELNNQLSNEAQNLTKALKGDSKVQGDWGEMILESILDRSGLTKGREYFVQESFDNEEGRKARPDVIVRYPGDRCVIIDSKVSLTNYEQYVNAKSEEEQKNAIKLHINSVSKHIKELSAKSYQDVLTDCKSPDFVMMFMPVEAAYLLAIHNNPNLWEDAYKKKVLLISPTNLIAALRMIAELWNQDKQNRNVAEIAEESGKLYDKFVLFLEDMDDIDKHIGKLRKTYDNARKKLESGSGNLIRRAEKIKKLGAKQKKSIPPSFLKAIEEENTPEENE